MREEHIFFLIFIILIRLQGAHACLIEGTETTQFFANTHSEIKQNGGKKQVDVFGCANSLKYKYLVLATGPDLINLNYQRGWSYTGFFHDDYCTIKTPNWIKSNPFTYQERLSTYSNRSNFIHQCLKMTVQSQNGDEVIAPNSPDNCTAIKIGPTKVELSGGFCFIKTDKNTNLTISYEIDPSCLKQFDTKIHDLSDLNFVTNFFQSADATGHSVDLEYLTVKEFNFYYTPKADSFSLANQMNFHSPRWPGKLTGNVHFSHLKIAKEFDETSLEVSIYADNRCQNSEILSAPTLCSFRSAIGTEMRLYELDKNLKRSHLLHLDYLGTILPPKWQGVIPFTRTLIHFDAIEPNRPYLISLNLSYPDTYFRLARDKISNFLIKGLNKKNSTIGVDSLPELTPLPELIDHKDLPDPQGLPDLVHFVDENSLTYNDPLHTLLSFLHLPGWPPYYTSVCDLNGKNCRNIYNNDLTNEILITFRLDSFSNEVEILKVEKNSNIFNSYSETIPQLPAIECL